MDHDPGVPRAEFEDWLNGGYFIWHTFVRPFCEEQVIKFMKPFLFLLACVTLSVHSDFYPPKFDVSFGFEFAWQDGLNGDQLHCLIQVLFVQVVIAPVLAVLRDITEHYHASYPVVHDGRDEVAQGVLQWGLAQNGHLAALPFLPQDVVGIDVVVPGPLPGLVPRGAGANMHSAVLENGLLGVPVLLVLHDSVASQSQLMLLRFRDGSKQFKLIVDVPNCQLLFDFSQAKGLFNDGQLRHLVEKLAGQGRKCRAGLELFCLHHLSYQLQTMSQL